MERKYYWPCCEYRDSNGETQTISTSDSAFSLDKAKDQIKIWKDHYKFDIISAWIDVYINAQKMYKIEFIERL